MNRKTIYARPREIDSLSQCDFYHAMDVPGYGEVAGEMDLRGRERPYLGGTDFSGKRVLEIGPASGFLTFHLESCGAEVVSLDLSENESWDVVPYARRDHESILLERKRGIRRVNNSFWLGHRAFESRAQVVYGTVYDLPRGIGPFDITTFCAVLVHLQNPFRALSNALALTRERVIVTEFVWNRFLSSFLLSHVTRPSTVFLPDYRASALWDTWWFLSPTVIREFLGVLGFEKSEVNYHFQRYGGKPVLCFSVVGERTRPGNCARGA